MLSVNVQHTERNALLYMAYTSGAEVSHTNRCRSVRTLRHRRHYNLVLKCPGAEVSREQ